MSSSLRPTDVYDEIRRVVLGQDEALREIAVAVVKHIHGHRAGNILLVGNSGTGKTTLMRAVEDYLARRPELAHFSNVIRINASVLAEDQTGYGRAVLGRLWRNAQKRLGTDAAVDRLRSWVERGIVFIDEVDKIRAEVGGTPNVRGITAQEALLTLMENEHLEMEAEDGSGQLIRINSASILFVAAGAFEEAYDKVYRRAVSGREGSPLRPVVMVSSTGELREEIPFQLRDYLRYDDLFAYGILPQFISRFESVVVLNELGENELSRIFVEPAGSIFRASREYFARFGIDLQITRGAIQLISWEAARQKRLGARALKEIYRRVIRHREFDPQVTGAGILTIDEDLVRKAIPAQEQGKSRAR